MGASTRRGKRLDRALRLYRDSDFAAAAALCREALGEDPLDVPALHLLGLLENRLGHPERAAEMLRRAVEADPASPDGWADLGMLLRKLGRAEAAETFRRALALRPGHANAHYHLGELAREQGDPVASRGHFESALRAHPLHMPCLRALAALHAESGRAGLAVDLLRRACDAEPRNPEIWLELCSRHAAAGHMPEASLAFTRAVDADPGRDATWRAGLVMAFRSGDKATGVSLCRQWLARKPGQPEARHMLAALQGETGGPARAPDEYITDLFDRFSKDFDANLAKLEYQAPQLVAEELRARLAQSGLTRVGRLLDAGCGTGLSGVPLRPLADHLEGVDLSPGMLAKAEARGIYDSLHAGELTAWLSVPCEPFDAIASADTLIYFGDWAAVTRALAVRLRPGGVLVATTESNDGPAPWRLEATGRYSHSRAGLESVLAAAGFTDIRLQPATLRLEIQRPVPGWVISAILPP